MTRFRPDKWSESFALDFFCQSKSLSVNWEVSGEVKFGEPSNVYEYVHVKIEPQQSRLSEVPTDTHLQRPRLQWRLDVLPR